MLKFFKSLSLLIEEKKYLLCLFPFFFMLLFVLTNDYPHNGEIVTNSYKYTGSILKDSPYGEGEILFKNGDKYSGEFKEGKFDGQGVFVSKEGKWTYTGNFKNGFIEGKGRLQTPDGVIHPVQFKKGVIQ
ncbi:MAG: hypothetical protein ACK5LM_00260 [Lactovum sp.]